MGQWVLLRHDLPDGTSHLDWMLERDDGASPGLLSFRLHAEVPWPPVGRFRGVQIGDHRREYLTYEGEVPGGRGTVRRLDGGAAEVRCVGSELRIVLERPGQPALRASRLGPGGAGGAATWLFEPVGPDLEI